MSNNGGGGDSKLFARVSHLFCYCLSPFPPFDVASPPFDLIYAGLLFLSPYSPCHISFPPARSAERTLAVPSPVLGIVRVALYGDDEDDIALVAFFARLR
ncbi:hypothetical protein CCMA1212_004552 [Trichoderma ghanense]|uniref:Uncharacterized protein n=1 Tax=Trichoderma ghanense TaxID=65468 RepID=A0ABY2H747_9HYPO